MLKRYNSYPDYFKSVFGERVQKLSINAGFTCPNRDGTCGIGGCTFCNALAFNPSYCDTKKTVTEQMTEGQIFHLTRYRRATKYLAYFQTFSNTHANIDALEKLFKEALDFPNTIGIVIGTRPDCIDKEKLDLIESIAKKYYVKLEFGIESTYDSTLERINRGHNFKTTVDAINATSERENIHIGGHLIFGLPEESMEMILNQASIISELPIETIKFHQLQIMKETLMAVDYLKNPDNYYFYELDEYLDLIVKFIEHLNPETVIERIASEVPPRFLLLPPKWDIRYDEVLRRFENKLVTYNTYQGRLYNSNKK
ncbi:MAG: TIGR01212 family radical SAM protein [Bacteroidales bacterium]|jgi:radical SAM protein (TIGR01212 family)|nr:TIGR01212 family radical SAM protein [Bacteroidales bacterium]